MPATLVGSIRLGAHRPIPPRLLQLALPHAPSLQTPSCLLPHDVSQVTYLAWAMETVPRDIYDDCHLYQVGTRWLAVLLVAVCCTQAAQKLSRQRGRYSRVLCSSVLPVRIQ